MADNNADSDDGGGGGVVSRRKKDLLLPIHRCENAIDRRLHAGGAQRVAEIAQARLQIALELIRLGQPTLHHQVLQNGGKTGFRVARFLKLKGLSPWNPLLGRRFLQDERR